MKIEVEIKAADWIHLAEIFSLRLHENAGITPEKIGQDNFVSDPS
jgi:hypothetical protein